MLDGRSKEVAGTDAQDWGRWASDDLTRTERVLIGLYRLMSEEDQEHLRRFAEVLAETS